MKEESTGVMMSARLSRRWVLAACSSVAIGAPAVLSARTLVPISEVLEGIRARIGGRLGVHALDTHSGERIGLDDDSRYAMASTFKLLLAAAVLSRVDRGALSLDRAVPVTKKDLLPHAPVTSELVSKGSATVQELCEAAVVTSDNPAANLLLSLIDGPAGFTRFVRTLGDTETRLDRYEIDLNSNLPGDPRDTTTPRAMVGSMEKVLVGDTLSAPSRDRLIQWLVDSKTGLERIRKGLPSHWKSGDKTGTGGNAAVNDIAITWPPGRKPVLIAVYTSGSTLGTGALAAAHAEVARLIVQGFRLPT